MIYDESPTGEKNQVPQSVPQSGPRTGGARGIPGTLRRHGRSQTWYWRLARRHVPEGVLGDRRGQFVDLPLIPPGQAVATKRRATAERLRRNWWRQWTGQRPSPGLAMARLLDRYEQYDALRAGPAAVRAHRGQIERFLGPCVDAEGVVVLEAVRGVEQITAGRVRAFVEFLAAGGAAANTRRNYRSAISKFGGWLRHHMGLLDEDIAAGVFAGAKPRPAPQFLLPSQVRALLRLAYRAGRRRPGHDIYLPILFCLLTMARRNEMMRMTAGMWRRGLIPGSKNQPSRPFRWTRNLAARIEPIVGDMADGEPLFRPRDATWWNQRLADLADQIPGYTSRTGKRVGRRWHMLRSTAATYYASAGMSPYSLMAAGGWTNLRTPMLYVACADVAGLGQNYIRLPPPR